MTGDAWTALLDDVVAIPGVRAALVAAVDDGLVIRDMVTGELAAADVAALASALVRRAGRLTESGGAPPTLVQLTAATGTVVAAAGPDPLWLVAVVAPDAELGRLRLLLGDRAGTLG